MTSLDTRGKRHGVRLAVLLVPVVINGFCVAAILRVTTSAFSASIYAALIGTVAFIPASGILTGILGVARRRTDPEMARIFTAVSWAMIMVVLVTMIAVPLGLVFLLVAAGNAAPY